LECLLQDREELSRQRLPFSGWCPIELADRGERIPRAHLVDDLVEHPEQGFLGGAGSECGWQSDGCGPLRAHGFAAKVMYVVGPPGSGQCLR